MPNVAYSKKNILDGRWLEGRLVLMLLCLVILPMILGGMLTYQQGNKAMHHQQQSLVEAISELQAARIEEWFVTSYFDLKVQASKQPTQQLLQSLKQGLKISGLSADAYVKTEDWARLANNNMAGFSSIHRNHPDIYDLLLVDLQGNILFSEVQKKDLGENIFSSLLLKDTLLAKDVSRTLINRTASFSGIQRYEVSDNRLAGFLTHPIRINGEFQGVLVMQLSFERLFSLIAADKTARSYIVDANGQLLSPLGDNNGAILQLRLAPPKASLLTKKQQGAAEHQMLPYDKSPEGYEVIGLQRTLQIPFVNWSLYSELESRLDRLPIFASGGRALLAASLIGLLTILAALLLGLWIRHALKALLESQNLLLEEKEQDLAALKDAFKEQTQLDHLLEQYKFALDQHAVLAITDVRGNILEVNEKFEQLSGYSKDELLGNNHRMLFSGLHSKAFFKEMYSKIAKGKVWHGTICNLNKKGELYWVDTTIVPLLDEKGKPERYVAIRTDMTSYKQMESQLHDTLLRFEIAADAAGFGVWELDLETQQMIWDKKMFSLYRADVNEGLDPVKLWRSRIHPDDYERALEEFAMAQRHEGVSSSTFRIVSPTGETRILQAHGVMQKNALGQLVRFVGINFDVTISKELEKALLEAKAAADHKVALKNQFLTNVSHEVRTPLNGVLGLSNLLSDTTLSESQTFLVDEIKKSGAELLRIVNDLLDFSSLEANAITMNLQSFCLKNALQEMLKKFSGLAAAKGISFNYNHAPEGEHWFLADKDKLIKVLEVILDNAVKFTDQGSVHFSYEAMSSEQGSIVFKFLIADTGAGISQDACENIFEDFSQVDGSSTRQRGGLGLGLSLAKKFVERMGGTIEVESVPHKGSQFWITLGLSLDEASVTPHELASARVLVVEDNLTNQVVLEAMLARLGIVSDVVNNGLEAIYALRTHDYEVVLMDCLMPVMDGFAATRRIRDKITGVRNKDIPVIAITANISDNDRLQCQSCGMNDFIAKPVDGAVLETTLKRWVKLPYRQQVLEHREPQSLASVTPPENKSSLVVFDYAALQERLEDNPELVKKVLLLFQNEAGQQIVELEALLVSAECEQLARSAHKLKGAAANIGAKKLAEQAKAIELLGKSGCLDGAEQLIESLKKAFNDLVEAKKEYQ